MKGCRAFTNKEIQDILGEMQNPRDRTWFLVGLYTGFRITELLNFRVKTVVQFGVIADEITIERAHMKRKRESRTIALNDDAKKVLKKYLQTLEKKVGLLPETFLFRSAKGKNRPISRIHADYILKKACQRLKITGNLGTHCMRKTYAIRMYEITGDIYKVQQALGHSDIASTLRYLPKDRDAINDAIQKLSFGVKIN